MKLLYGFNTVGKTSSNSGSSDVENCGIAYVGGNAATRQPIAATNELCFCNSSLQEATVTGFVQAHRTDEKTKRRGNIDFQVDYDYVIEVYWSGGDRRYIRRNYADFVKFQNQLLKSFKARLEKGTTKFTPLVPDDVNKLSAKYNASTAVSWSLFSRRRKAENEQQVGSKSTPYEVAEEIEVILNRWLQNLLDLPEDICNSSVVEDFFEARDTDPVRASHRPNSNIISSISPTATSPYPPSSALSSPSSSLIASSTNSGVDSTYSSLSDVGMLNNSRLLSISSRRVLSSEPSTSDIEDDVDDEETDDYFFDEEMDQIVLQGNICTNEFENSSFARSSAFRGSLSRRNRCTVDNSSTSFPTPVNSHGNSPSASSSDERFDYDSCLADLSSLMKKVSQQNANSSNRLTQVWLE